MAASYGHSIGRASVGGGGSWLEPQLLLPSGACGFRDLNAGAAAPTCGCRRFWLASPTASGVQQGSERVVCYCGHHACFHESAVVPQIPNTHSVETGHNVRSPAGGYIPAQQYFAAGAPTWSQLIRDNTRSGNEKPEVEPCGSTAGLGIRSGPATQTQSQSVNTRLWQALNGFARDQANGSASGDTSRLPSTAVPSVVGESIEFPQAVPLDSDHRRHAMGPPSNMPPAIANEARAYSATEVATPSVRGTPEPSAFTGPGIQATASPMGVYGSRSSRNAAQHAMTRHAQGSESSQPRLLRPSTVGPSLSIQEMCNTIQNYGRRIDNLETMSFTHLPSDEVIDRFDMVDGRILDLEQWRTDQDRAQEADDVDERLDAVKNRLDELEQWRETEAERPAPASSSMRHLLPETSSFASDGSFDSDAAAQTEAIVLATLAANAETRPRIDALESRIMDLENATMPSFARPWRIQVVLLPFGRQLPGIWFSSSESTQQSQRTATQASEEWSGPTASKFSAQTSFSSDADTGAWTTESIEAWSRRTEDEWLSAKACGPSGDVFKRLESRGLVRDIVLTAADARHFCTEITNAFGTVLETTPQDVPGRFHGLQERFIPLRKVRKSSRLRFLSTGEMISPALWNATLLENVFMKVNDGQRRLYMTTPDAYLQPLHDGWTWQSLKHLPIYGADGELQAAQVVGNVLEKCWTYNDRLDHATSLNTSFASQASPWEISSEDSNTHHEESNESGPGAVSPQALARSSSLPNSVSMHAMEVDTLSKRRVASFEIDSTMAGAENKHDSVSKRRRVSSSPELERRGVNFTPRWSREPPSPFPSDDIGVARSQAASSRPRGTTPFAYATPHSNLDFVGDGGDTEVDTEPPLAQSDNGEDSEEWEGMQDAHEGDRSRTTCEADLDLTVDSPYDDAGESEYGEDEV